MKLRRAAALLTFLLLLQMGISVLAQIIIATYYGTTAALDVYLAGITIPTVVFMACASSLGVAAVSYFHETKARYDADEASRQVMFLAFWVFCITLIVSLTLIAAAGPIVTWLVPGFDTDSLQHTTSVLRISACALPLLSSSSVVQALLQANHRFYGFSFAGIAQVGLVPTFILLGASPTPEVLAWGFNLGAVVSFIILTGALIRGSLLKFGKPRSLKIGRMAALGLPLLVSALVTHSLWLSERHFASSLGEGAISALSYAQRVVNLFSATLTYGLTTVLLPALAERLENFQLDDAGIINRKALFILITPTAVCLVALVLFSNRIIALAFERGAFASTATKLTSTALAMYAGLLFYNVFGAVVTKNAMAAKEGWLIASTSCVLLLSFLILAPVTVSRFGFAGLPLATSIAFLISLTILTALMVKRHPRLYRKSTSLLHTNTENLKSRALS